MSSSRCEIASEVALHGKILAVAIDDQSAQTIGFAENEPRGAGGIGIAQDRCAIEWRFEFALATARYRQPGRCPRYRAGREVCCGC